MKGKFQIIIIIVFILAAVFGILVFSGAIPIGQKDNVAKGAVTLWGTIKPQIIRPILDVFNYDNKTFTVKYVQKETSTFDADLLEAIASGTGPDLFFLTEDLVFKYSNKIYTIPYQSFSLSNFKNTFAGASEIFLTTKGILALPVTIDPLMMYYNRSILDANAVAYPPVYWDEFEKLIPLLNQKDAKGVLVRSTAALGQFANISHAKDILATLFLQSGNTIVAEREDSFVSTLYEKGGGRYDLGSILEFYTDFANPLKSVYAWNRSFPNSLDTFIKEDLAFYFGFASELESLVKKNPNLNFEVASIPQVKSNNFKLTNANVMGIAISSSSKNLSTALTAASLMVNTDFTGKLAKSLGVPPARRDLLKTLPGNVYLDKFYASAFFAKSWLDPSPEKTNEIFQGMIEKVLSNTLSPKDAVNDANTKLNLLLIKKI